MKIQLALDVGKKKALQICKKISKYVDIIELGTPLIKQEGLKIIKEFKKFRKPILADLKTMDVGFLEAEMAFKAGADITTVCGSADLPTIQGAIKAGKKYNKKVLVDLIGMKINKKTKQIKKLNPDYICVHTSIDTQKKGKTPLKNLKKISKIISNMKIAVAGGINLKNINSIIKYKPEIIIIGGAITKSKEPEEIIKKLKEKI
jgi:3-hexulose-6-phosphate synthase